jgi:tetratricopeptide (TPR) repeat protein
MEPLLKKVGWFFVGLLALCRAGTLPAAPPQESVSATAQATRWVDEGLRSFQAAPLSAAAAVLVPCAEDPAMGFDCAYQAARAYLYLSYVLELAGRKAQARDCLGPATRWAKAAAIGSPASALAHSLLAQVYGRRILLGNAFTAMRYGPLNGAETAAAVRLAPEDPQVLETQGLRYLYAPALFGGNAGKAQACFERSLKAEDSDLTRYFLALALMKRGENVKAHEELLKARGMNPANGLVNAALGAQAPFFP